MREQPNRTRYLVEYQDREPGLLAVVGDRDAMNEARKSGNDPVTATEISDEDAKRFIDNRRINEGLGGGEQPQPIDSDIDVTALLEYMKEVANQFGTNKELIDRLTARVDACVLNDKIIIEVVAIPDDDNPTAARYPLFAHAFNLTDTSPKSDWVAAIAQFRKDKRG